jgi:TonB family protein
MTHALRSGLLLSVLFLVPAVPALAGDATVSPGHDEELREASALIARREYRPAIAFLERVDQLAGGQCAECQVRLAEAHMALGERREAAAAAQAALTRLDDPGRVAWASALLGHSLMNPEAKRGELAAAEEAVRRVIKLGDVGLQSWGHAALSWISFQREHYDDAVVEGRAYLEDHPTGEGADIERRIVCTARSLGHVPAPELEPVPDHPQGKVSRPVPVFRPSPGYTEGALAAHLRGTVIAESIIDGEGCVENVKILKSLDPDLDQNVLDTLRYWAFLPAAVDGHPVKVFFTLTVNFAAPDEPEAGQ